MLHAVGELAANVRYQPRRPGTGLAEDFQVCGRDAGQERKHLSALLISGPFWFHRLFAVWWTWDKVLTWGVLVWPVYLSCLLLRQYANVGQASTLAAVLSVFAFLYLPLAYFSVILRQPRGSSVVPVNEVPASLVCIVVSVTVLAAVAIWLLYQRARNQQEV